MLFDAIKAGAAAFILKDIGPDDLVTIIRRVNNGEYLINDKVFARPAVASRVLKEFRELAVYGQEAAPIFAPLSPREVEILDNIAKGMTNKQVAYSLSISEQTVKNHMSSILRKLSVNDRTQAVVYAMKQGWISDPRGLTTDVGGPGWPSAPAEGPGAAPGAPATGGGDENERALLAAMEAVRATIADEVGSLDTELGEIDMLASQATAEADRHEERRARAEERVTALELDPRADPKDLKEARSQLLTQIRRAALFEAQQQLLEGKQRTLQRFRDRMARADEDLRSVRASSVRGAGGGGSAYAAALAVRPGGGDTTDPSVLLRAQEELRREIARQMHDGPAQSLANIALQAEIVLRLASRGDPADPGRAGSAAGDGGARPRGHQGVHLRRPTHGPRRPRPRAHAASHRARPGRQGGGRDRPRLRRDGAAAPPGHRERRVPAHR